MSSALLRSHTSRNLRRCVNPELRRLIPEKVHACMRGQRVVFRSLTPMNASSSAFQTYRKYHVSVNPSFRSSLQLMLPVRRRRRGTARKTEQRTDDENPEEDDGTTTLERLHSPVQDLDEFSQASTQLLDKLEKAMEPMKMYNEIFVTKRADGEIGEIFTIDLGPKLGLYQVEISLDERVFEYCSPISGRLLYCLSSSTREWVNVDDGHQFEGILVRDLLRSNCIGLPKL